MTSQFTLRLVQGVVLVDYAAVGAMRTVLPYYAKQLGASGQRIGGLETVYGIGQLAGGLIFGALSDTRGRVFVLLFSFAGAAVGYGLASLAVGLGSVTLLLLSRLPVGLAKQTVTATRAIVSDLTPPDARRSEALAKLFAGCSLGYAIGPYVGGLLADRAGATPLPAMICAGVFVALIPLVSLSLPETSTAALGASKAGEATRSNDTAPRPVWSSGQSLLLLAVALPEGALVLSLTPVTLLAHDLEWPAATLGLFNSVWGVCSGVLSLTLWPRLLKGRYMSDVAALHLGTVSLGLASATLAYWPSEAALWGVVRRRGPLGL